MDSLFGLLDIDQISHKQKRDKSLVLPSSSQEDLGQTKFDFTIPGLMADGYNDGIPLEPYNEHDYQSNSYSNLDVEHSYGDDFRDSRSNGVSGVSALNRDYPGLQSLDFLNLPNQSKIGSANASHFEGAGGPNGNYLSQSELFAMKQQQRFDLLKQQQRQKVSPSGSGMNPNAPAFTLKSNSATNSPTANEYFDRNVPQGISNHNPKYMPPGNVPGMMGQAGPGLPIKQRPNSNNSPVFNGNNFVNEDMLMKPVLSVPAVQMPELPLKVLSIDVNGSFHSMDTVQERSQVFDFIDYCGAQVILMNNTGLVDENQLKIVRNEIKMKFNTESAMWASFGSSEPGGGRGVGVLVLGPLAPRTGWIRSDESGRYIRVM
jgi:hypothetical protein